VRRRVCKLNPHLHSEKETNQSTRERRRTRPRGLHQTRNFLCVTIGRREVIPYTIVGMHRHVLFVEIKATMSHPTRRRKPCFIELIHLNNLMEIRILQSNNIHKGTWRGGL
jgi:hypothetical protein